MAVAVNRLADGLSRTREFSLQVGQGQFEAEYTPLSEDDALGQAILKMRDDLANNEREMEAKVDQRTAEVKEQKAVVESLYGDLRDSIDYAKRIQQAILPSENGIFIGFTPLAGCGCFPPSTAQATVCQGPL